MKLTNEMIQTLDIHILISIINSYLRDFYDSVESMCDDLMIDIDLLNSRLHDYKYSREQNRYL